MKIHYMPIDKADTEEILLLFNNIYADYYWPNQHTLASLQEIMSYMSIDGQLSVIMMIGKIPIGLALIARRKSRVWLYCFGIVPDKRQQGYGQALLDHIILQCQKSQIKQIGLEVLLQNNKARDLYYKYQFKRYCYLDSYSTMLPLKAGYYQEYQFQEKINKSVLIRLRKQQQNVVWSRQYSTLLKRNINWSVAYYQTRPVAVLAYDSSNSLSLYRLDALDGYHAEKALHTLINVAQKNNPHCVRKVAVNINHDSVFENRVISNLGLKRFMRQEYLVALI